MNKRPTWVNILLFIGFLFVAATLLNIAFSIVGSILWLVVKFLIPIAIIVWIVRKVSEPRQRYR